VWSSARHLKAPKLANAPAGATASRQESSSSNSNSRSSRGGRTRGQLTVTTEHYKGSLTLRATPEHPPGVLLQRRRLAPCKYEGSAEQKGQGAHKDQPVHDLSPTRRSPKNAQAPSPPVPHDAFVSLEGSERKARSVSVPSRARHTVWAPSHRSLFPAEAGPPAGGRPGEGEGTQHTRHQPQNTQGGGRQRGKADASRGPR
jgi:hypothetical protein